MSSGETATQSKRSGALACHTQGRGSPLVLLHGGAGSWTHWMRNLPAPESADDAPLDIHHANVIRARFDSRRFSLSEHTRRALPKVQTPTLVIFGEQDNLAWPSVHARLDMCRAAKPDVRTALVAGAGHWLQYEAADAVNRSLIDFFSHDDRGNHA